MPIPVTCECGRTLRVKDEAAGRTIRCPGCGVAIPVAQPNSSSDVDDEALDILLSTPDVPSSSSTSVRVAPPEEETPRPTSRPPAPSPPPKRPSKPPRPRRTERREESEGGGFRIAVHPSIIMGLLMMAGAALWFFLGLAAGRIFFYPAVLFMLGIGSIVRGFRGED